MMKEPAAEQDFEAIHKTGERRAGYSMGKGVILYRSKYGATAKYAEWLAEAGAFSEKDVLGNQAPFYFDGSVKDLYMTLKCGATCEILPKKLFLFPKPLVDYLNQKKVTALQWATSAEASDLIAGAGAVPLA